MVCLLQQLLSYMLAFYEVFILYRKIQKVTQDFSGMRCTMWVAGTAPEFLSKEQQQHWFFIDCTNEGQSNFLLNFLKIKGVQESPDSSTGRYLYLHPKESA